MTNSVIQYIPNSSVIADFKKHYADAAIDDGTIFCYDLSNPASWVSQANSAGGESVLNLVSGGAPATVSGAMTFSGGGLSFTTSANQRIALPDAAKLDASVENFIWSLYFAPGAQTQAINELGGYHYADTGPYGLRTVSASVYRAICAGATQQFSPSAGVHALHVALQKTDTNAGLAHFFLDKVLLSSQAVALPLQQPSTAVAVAALGDAAGTSYGGTWVGKEGKSWLTTKQRTLAQIKDWVAQDYDLSVGYFSP